MQYRMLTICRTKPMTPPGCLPADGRYSTHQLSQTPPPANTTPGLTSHQMSVDMRFATFTKSYTKIIQSTHLQLLVCITNDANIVYGSHLLTYIKEQPYWDRWLKECNFCKCLLRNLYIFLITSSIQDMWILHSVHTNISFFQSLQHCGAFYWH